VAADGSEDSNMNTTPIETLQIKALEQRKELHHTFADLRDKVMDTREKFKVSNQARNHLLAASAVAAVLGLASGYGVAGIFTRN
jgi:hypothetical protein